MKGFFLFGCALVLLLLPMLGLIPLPSKRWFCSVSEGDREGQDDGCLTTGRLLWFLRRHRFLVILLLQRTCGVDALMAI